MEETKQEPCFKNGLVTWQPFCSGSKECKLLTQPVTLPASTTMLALHCSLLEDCCLVKPSSPRALFHCVAGCSLSANPLLHRNSIVRAAINISWNSCRRAKEPISDTFRFLHLVTQQCGFNSFFLLRRHKFAILIALKLNSRQQGKVVEGVNSAERLHLLVCSRYSTSSLEVQPLVEKTDWLHHINLPPGLFLFHFC